MSKWDCLLLVIVPAFSPLLHAEDLGKQEVSFAYQRLEVVAVK